MKLMSKLICCLLCFGLLFAIFACKDAKPNSQQDNGADAPAVIPQSKENDVEQCQLYFDGSDLICAGPNGDDIFSIAVDEMTDVFLRYYGFGQAVMSYDGHVNKDNHIDFFEYLFSFDGQMDFRVCDAPVLDEQNISHRYGHIIIYINDAGRDESVVKGRFNLYLDKDDNTIYFSIGNRYYSAVSLVVAKLFGKSLHLSYFDH